MKKTEPTHKQLANTCEDEQVGWWFGKALQDLGTGANRFIQGKKPSGASLPQDDLMPL